MCQVGVAEMNESELSMKCRKEPLGDVENVLSTQRMTSPADIWYWLGGIRHIGSMNATQALVRNVGTCPMLRERRGAEALQAPEYRCETQGQMAS